MTKTKIGFGAAIILAIGGFFASLGIKPHRDPGLQRVCFDAIGHAHYKAGPDCTAMRDVRWSKSQFPLSVTTSSRGERTKDANVAEAISNVNSQMGFRAFVLWSADADKDPAVQVALDVPAERGWMDAGGDVRFNRASTGVLSAAVRTCNAGDIATLHKVLVHEFGHVLGLAHDDFEDSAMWPDIAGERLGLRFTDGDRGIVRRLYR